MCDSSNELVGQTKMDINMYLEKDSYRVAGQNYGIISIVSPTSNQKYEKVAIKFKGCFNTYEEAKDQAQKLHKMDNTFDIHVIEMYSWIVVPPERDNLKEVHYDNDVLDSLITEHVKQQDMAKVEFEKYKREMLEYGRKHAQEAAEKERLEVQKRLENMKVDEPQTEELAEDEPTNVIDSNTNFKKSDLEQMIDASDELNFSREPLEPIKPFRQNATSELV
jgi:hypothetical protein